MSREGRRIRRAVERKGRKVALRAARELGCTCAAEPRVVGWHQPGVPRVDVFHDANCALIRSQEGPGPPAASAPRFVAAHDPELAALQLRLMGAA